MKKDKQTSFKAISPDFKRLGIPLLSLVGIVICFLFAIRIGFNQINDQRKKIKDTEKNITILEQKVESLFQIKQILSDQIKFFSLALPDSNPAFSIIYQVKRNSLLSGLLPENIKGGSETKGNSFLKTDINFDLDGDLNQIISFLKMTQEFSPIVTVEKLKISQGSFLYRGSVVLRGYWAPYPQKIPAVTQPLSDFSEEEMEMIIKISNLIIPPFAEIRPGGVSERSNPFE